MDPAASSARASLEAFATAFNARDLEGVRDACNFPHVVVAGGRASIAATRDDLTVDFTALERTQGWHRTTFDDVEEVDVAQAMVSLRFTYTRHTLAGAAYLTARAEYLFTDHDGHWGRQLQLLF
jgi:hypothetical protein